MQSRLRIVGVFFGIASFLLVARLFFWQVLRAGDLSIQARQQQQTGTKITAPRGNILASDGSWLAATTQAWLMFATKPDLTQSNKAIANRLAPLLLDELDEGQNFEEELLKEAVRIENLLKKEGAVWVPIKHKVSEETKNNIEALEIGGIGFEPEEDRFYPEASAAAQVLGFVGKDDEGIDKGYFGVEGFYDLTLSGKPGFLDRISDATGAPILFGGSREIAAVEGVDLLTHIDKTIQLVVEEKLERGIEKYGASAGWVVVLDPATGGIMAAASTPSYDPAKYFEYGDSYFKNPIISDSFEPGSIFKPIVMASGLDAGVIKPDTKCDICGSPVKVDKYTIETWNDEYRPDSTMTDVIVHSDNVGMTFVSDKLGADALYDYLTKFGIGVKTQIDLQGEGNPSMRDRGTWNVVDLATAAFGQGIAVTPIQLVRAVSVIANDGVITTPQVVNKIKIDGWEQDIIQEKGERVISKKTAEEITQMMVLAAAEGEAKWITSSRFNVAGKTGTAQIPVEGHYDDEKTIGSFVGFAPADKPKFVMLVSLREPQTSPWASETAAPLWFSIANELFPYLGIQPEN